MSERVTTQAPPRTVIDVDELVNVVGELVSFPAVHLRLGEALDDPDSTSQDIARLVGQDPALAVRVLRIANSPLYGLSRQVETLERAVTVLGVRQMRELVLAASVGGVVARMPNVLYEMDDFWRHSILCGLTARRLASACARVETDFAFVAGLLHDIGQLVLFNRYPGQSRVVLELAMDRAQPLEMYQAERKVFGFDHAALGGRLLEIWQLPERLRECVEYHHEPALAPNYPVEVAIVHMANTVTRISEVELSVDEALEGIDRVCWEVTGLAPAQIGPALADAEAAVGEMRHQLLD